MAKAPRDRDLRFVMEMENLGDLEAIAMAIESRTPRVHVGHPLLIAACPEERKSPESGTAVPTMIAAAAAFGPLMRCWRHLEANRKAVYAKIATKIDEAA